MSKLSLQSNFQAYSDNLDTNDPKDVTKIQILTEESSFNCLNRQKIKIADTTVDQSIAIAEPNSEYLLIYTDQIITIKADGSSDSRTLKPKTAGIKTLAYLERGDVTSITVSNSSGAEANLDIISAKL